jgi:uncharacterized phage-associated protein
LTLVNAFRAFWARFTYIEAMATYSAATVANRLLELAAGAGKAVTPLQLLKLVYICHGWSLGLRDQPLIAESVEAWRYGPVVPDLYKQLKKYGSGPVKDKLGFSFWPGETMSDDDRNFVDRVYATYGNYNGIQLSHLTHMVGTPWQQVYLDNQFGIAIPNELIADHYKKLAVERSKAN